MSKNCSVVFVATKVSAGAIGDRAGAIGARALAIAIRVAIDMNVNFGGNLKRDFRDGVAPA